MQPPRVTATRIVYENRWMRLHEDITERADGTPGLYAWIQKPPAAVIVPLDDGHVWLVEQHRHPIGARFWELPQGAWEDDPTAAAEDLARGELAEETGLRAARIEHLGRLYFAYGITDQSFDVWRATGLEPGEQALEATEADLRVERFTVADFEAMIDDGRIRDAATVSAWHLATRSG
ncbi:MAG TPA: NUDIX hydrolase [Solirubrobacteraceae bacterium]|nr:NUDIX hydrolase [Solirubrobacteraceae bacterium]